MRPSSSGSSIHSQPCGTPGNKDLQAQQACLAQLAAQHTAAAFEHASAMQVVRSSWPAAEHISCCIQPDRRCSQKAIPFGTDYTTQDTPLLGCSAHTGHCPTTGTQRCVIFDHHGARPGCIAHSRPHSAAAGLLRLCCMSYTGRTAGRGHSKPRPVCCTCTLLCVAWGATPHPAANPSTAAGHCQCCCQRRCQCRRCCHMSGFATANKDRLVCALHLTTPLGKPLAVACFCTRNRISCHSCRHSCCHCCSFCCFSCCSCSYRCTRPLLPL